MYETLLDQKSYLTIVSEANNGEENDPIMNLIDTLNKGYTFEIEGKKSMIIMQELLSLLTMTWYMKLEDNIVQWIVFKTKFSSRKLLKLIAYYHQWTGPKILILYILKTKWNVSLDNG